MRLCEVLKIDQKFQTAVNLKLDLKHYDKLTEYIPTTASLQMLKRYLESIFETNADRASMLYAAYGRGKSHMVLVLLGILQSFEDEQGKKAIQKLVENISYADKAFAKKLQGWISRKKKYLPVLISFGRETSLEQSYLLALNEALESNGLAELTPNTYYKEALKTIMMWKKNYSATYSLLEQKLSEAGMDLKMLQTQLEKNERKSLELFMELYPQLTAGSVFNPMISMDVLDVYQEISKEIQNYGYEGIIIVFDEFSKFLESSTGDAVSVDMKLVQDICELCNTQKKGASIRQIFIAHKPVREYGRHLSKEVIDAFEGTEKRLVQIPFQENYCSPYELMKNVLKKEKTHFVTFCREHQINLEKIAEKSYKQADFYGNFSYEEFLETVVKGCFPMLPITAYILLKVSNYAGQNERTIFTFLASDEEYSLYHFIKEAEDEEKFAGIDLVYDYFQEEFEHDRSNERVHNEYLKANYILNKQGMSFSQNQKKLIKALALFAIGCSDTMAANEQNLQLATGIPEEELKKELGLLLQAGVLAQRKRNGTFLFRKELNINLEEEILRVSNNDISDSRINLAKELGDIFERKYELPKKYNQQKMMVRFFSYQFMQESVLQAQLMDSSVLFQENKENQEGKSTFSDGKIICLLSTKKPFSETLLHKVSEKVEQLRDERIYFLLPTKKDQLFSLVKKYLAVCMLKENQEFLLENEMALEELLFYEDELKEELNQEILDVYFSEGNIHGIRYDKEKKKAVHQTLHSLQNLREELSAICGQVYKNTPRINHELINRRNISSQIRKARDTIITAFFENDQKLMDSWKDGTGAEATIYRAVFCNVGLLSGVKAVDTETEKTIQIIRMFVESAAGKQVSFGKLYMDLQGTRNKIGIRRGVIPLYLAYVLREFMIMDSRNSGIPVIYVDKMEQTVSAKLLNMVDEEPSKYSLYMEKDTLEHQQYLQSMRQLFATAGLLRTTSLEHGANDGLLLFPTITESMREWYQALPNYSKLTKKVERDKKLRFRRSLAVPDLNPREYLFEDIVSLFSEEDREGLEVIFQRIESAKKEIDGVFSEFWHQLALSICTLLYKNERVEKDEKSESAFSDGKKMQEGEFRARLVGWSEQARMKTKGQLLNRKTSELLRVAEEFSTEKDFVLLNQLSNAISGVYLEELTDESKNKFLDDIADAVAEVKEKSSEATTDEYTNLKQGKFLIHMGDGQNYSVSEDEMKKYKETPVSYLTNEVISLVNEYNLEKKESLSAILKAIEEVMR